MFQNFLNELKRRRVVRISGVYAVTCWGLFQIANNLFPALHLPSWSVTLVAVLLMLGFPLTLVIAWAFEKGPDGPRLTEPAADLKAHKFGWTDGLFAVAAVAIIAITLAQMSGLGARPKAAAPQKATVLAPGIPAKSVAVLPFVNFSQQQDAGFFADGLTEEVINSLAQIPDLKVAGRTSAFYFKGKSEDLREVGRKLGVAHVVEGSVQRSGDKLRVTAQLISVADGFHVWSKTYDRDMNDAFAIQTEIANAVAEALKTKLLAAGPTPKTRNPELYRQELVARAQLHALGLNELTAARETYRKLMAAEPDNADVFAGYAFATATLAQNYLTIDFNQGEKEASAAIAKALAINPRSAAAYVAKGVLCQVQFVRMGRQACIQEIGQAYTKALELDPRNPEVMTFHGIFLTRTDPAGAIPVLKRALEIDPLNRIARNGLAGAYESTGQRGEAERQYKATIEAYPDFVDAKQELGELYVSEGRLDLARPWIKLAAAPGTDPSSSLYLAMIDYNLGLPDRAMATLNGVKQPPIAAKVARAIPFVVSGDFKGLLTYSQTNLAADGDPIWRSGILTAAVMMGRYDLAREQLLVTIPELFQPTPQVEPGLANDFVNGAQVLDALGDKAQARRVALAVLSATAPRPKRPQSQNRRLARVKAYALLGDKEHALGELRGAIDDGYRTLVDIDAFIRLDRYPVMANLRGDPRFQAMLREVEADNAKQRKAVLETGG